ncbi:AarF/UbiB family protein [Mesorhizobium sp. VNQ89]|uniref:ABC1 kinase family protein n=1 Tax=Mesorhizobium quangtriensis TaxID=3157709 RepID=UPI0032B727FF
MIARFFQIVVAASSLILLYLGERRRGVSADASALPLRLRQTLDDLGATFIKIGQALSMRPDLFPEPYLRQLRDLREHARPFSAREARAELEHALRRPIDEVFRTFASEPFAAASIAQVHHATLPDGQDVIVKIRRPHMRERIDGDMRILVIVARLAAAAVPGLRRFQLERLVREIWANLARETNLLQEARNIRRFGDAYKQRSDVYVPAAFEALCSEAVLVLVLSHGRSIEDPITGQDGPRIAGVLVDFYLEQLLKTGLFHGDPHPGNLFLMEDGRICFHDFGLVGYLDRSTRRNLGIFLQAFVQQDAAWMLDAAIELALIDRRAERTLFVHGIDEILSDYSSLPLKDWSIADAFLRVMRLGDSAHAAVPYNLMVLVRALFLIEGCLRRLDPDFNVLDNLIAKGEAAIAHTLGGRPDRAAMERLKTELALSVQDLPALLGAWLHRAYQQGGEPALGVRLAHSEERERRLDRRAGLTALALLSAGLLVASALLAQVRIGPLVLGLPLAALIGFAVALWLCLRVLRLANALWRR